MVIAEIFAKFPALVSLIENDEVIQTISADGTDHAFNERISPRRSRRGYQLLYSQAIDPSLHQVTRDAIPISH